MRYETTEDAVEIDDDGQYTTYTSGARDPLYRGTDAQAARESLNLSEDEWCALLASDPL